MTTTFSTHLQEGKCHATANDQLVDLVQHVLDQLDLVGNLGSTENGQEWTRGVVESLVEVLQLLLEKEAGGSGLVAFAEHGGVSSVGSAEGVVDVDVAQLGKAGPELLDLDKKLFFVGRSGAGNP